MPVSLNFRAIRASILLLGLVGCSPQSQPVSTSPFNDYDKLSTALGEIQVNIPPIDDLPGDSRTENLLYLSGITSQMQTAMLITYDTQVKTIRLAGNNVLADELDGNRDIMMQAVELELGPFVKEAAVLYERMLEPDEIERLIAIHTDPTMQKLIQLQPQLAQDVLPIAESFGLKVGARYDSLSKAKAKTQK